MKIEIIIAIFSGLLGYVLARTAIYFYLKSKKCCTKKYLVSTGIVKLSNPPLYEYKCSKCGKIHLLR